MDIAELPKQEDHLERSTSEKNSAKRTSFQNRDPTLPSNLLLVDQHANFSSSSPMLLQSPQAENGLPNKQPLDEVIKIVKQPNRRVNLRSCPAENKSTRRTRSQHNSAIASKQLSVEKDATFSSSSVTQPLCPLTGNDVASNQLLAEKEGSKAAKQPKRKNNSRRNTAEPRLTKKSSSRQGSATSQNMQLLVEKDVPLSRPSSTQPVCPQASSSSATKVYPDPVFHQSAKIKLQLFPLDDFTRTGLEQDGHNPHLELTLNPRKKISSVVKHLNNKWGSSSVGFGEPMLFPYSALLDNTLGDKVWTLNDIAVSAGEVHAALGNPPIFRLRYGWIFQQQQFASTSHTAGASLNEDLQTSCSRDLENHFGSENKISSGSSCFPSNKLAAATETKVVSSQTKVLDAPVPSMDDNLRMDTVSLQPMDIVSHQTPIQWQDSLTNISIGGLLSEASLQGIFKILEKKQDGPKAVSHDLMPASIFDAEETCQAFSFQKLKSSGNNAVTFDRTANSKVNSRAGAGEDNVCHAAKTDHLLCSQVYNDERSLGLRGIKWTESLGPFDLQLPSSRKIINGDSISLGSIIS